MSGGGFWSLEERHGVLMDPAEYERKYGGAGSEEIHGMQMDPSEYKRRGYTESGVAG